MRSQKEEEKPADEHKNVTFLTILKTNHYNIWHILKSKHNMFDQSFLKPKRWFLTDFLF